MQNLRARPTHLFQLSPGGDGDVGVCVNYGSASPNATRVGLRGAARRGDGLLLYASLASHAAAASVIGVAAPRVRGGLAIFAQRARTGSRAVTVVQSCVGSASLGARGAAAGAARRGGACPGWRRGAT